MDPPPEVELDNPGFFSTGNAMPLPAEIVIISLLVAYRELNDDKLDAWCKDVLEQEPLWLQVRCVMRAPIVDCCVSA